LENSTLLSDKCTSKTDIIHNNIQNSEISNVTAIKYNERCNSKLNKELNITEILNVCSNAISEEHITNLQNDNLSINTLPNNLCNTEQTSYIENNLKEMISDCKEKNSTNICILNKSNNIHNDSSVSNFIKDKISNNEKLFIVTTGSSSNNDNLVDKIVKNVANNNHSTEYSTIVKINNKQDSVDLIKADNINNSLHQQDSIEHKNKKGNLKDERIRQDKYISKTKSMHKGMGTSLIQNQNNLSNVKGRKEIMNENHDINSVIEINKNTKSMLKTILLSSNMKNLNNENKIKNENQRNIDTIVPRRRRSKRISAVQDCATEEDKQGRKYFT
jgi:hypothetical protein